MRRARVLALANDIPPGDLLEVGCGAGMLLQEFAVRGFCCTALETSAAALALARTLAEDAGQAIDFRERPSPRWRGRFDALFAFEVLEHAADDHSTLATWAGWLRPGGWLLLSVPAHASAWTAHDVWAGHYRRYEREGLNRLLDQAGFEVERLECYGFPLANLTERIGAICYGKGVQADSRPDEAGRRAQTARSGIDRGRDVALYPLLRTPPGRLAMRGWLALQRPFLATDLGSGYLLRARRR